MKAAHDEWRSETDQLAQFIDECCVVGDGSTAQASLLFCLYKHWCEKNGERTLTAHAFGKRLGEKGFAKHHTEKGTQYQRIGLKGDALDRLTADAS